MKEPLRKCLGMRLSLAALGFFLTDEAVAYLQVVPTGQLLKAHGEVVAAMMPNVSDLWPYYLPDQLLSHTARSRQAYRRKRMP